MTGPEPQSVLNALTEGAIFLVLTVAVGSEERSPVGHVRPIGGPTSSGPWLGGTAAVSFDDRIFTSRPANVGREGGLTGPGQTLRRQKRADPFVPPKI